MTSFRRVAALGSIALGGMMTAAFLGLSARFYVGRRSVERSWTTGSPPGCRV